MIGSKNDALDLVVPGGDPTQYRLHLAVLAHIATGKECQGAKTHGTAQHVTAIDLLDQLPVFLEGLLIDAARGSKD